MSLSDFRPTNLVAHLHDKTPRFGHPNSFALLMSSDASSVSDYKNGIVAFCIFLFIFSFVWVIVLLVLKFYYGVDRVGCAASGNVVDIKTLKKQNISKHERKIRILRNWRVQTACLFACICLIPLSILMLQFGLVPFVSSIDDLQDVSSMVEERAKEGIILTSSLTIAYDNLKDLLKSKTIQESLDFDQICPEVSNGASNATERPFIDFSQNGTTENIFSGLQQIHSFMLDYQVSTLSSSLQSMTNATATVERTANNVIAKDWIIKLMVVLLDVIVFFLIAAILFTKRSFDFPAYQRLTTWMFVPLFCCLLVASVFGTCVFVSLAITNADFCAGGDMNPSPIGSIRDVLVQENANVIFLQALDFYESDCLIDNPLSFLSDLESKSLDIHTNLQNLYNILNSDMLSSALKDQCEENNLATANGTLSILTENVRSFQEALRAAIDLTGCSSMSPVFRRLNFGSTCTDSVEGLTWLFSTMLAVTIMGLVVLSTRAAFYNPVIRGRRRKRREKEFKDYKAFMSKFYDTSEWTIDNIPDEVDYDVNPLSCSSNPDYHSSSDETYLSSESPSKDAAEQEDDCSMAPHLAGIAASSSSQSSHHIGKQDAMEEDFQDHGGDDDSYDSTYSVDQEESVSSSFFQILHITRTQSHQIMHHDDPSDLSSRMSARSVFSSFIFGRSSSSSRRDEVHESISHAAQSSTVGSKSSTPIGRRMRSNPLSLGRTRIIWNDSEEVELQPLSPSPQHVSSQPWGVSPDLDDDFPPAPQKTTGQEKKDFV